jgi:hypothetical protein
MSALKMEATGSSKTSVITFCLKPEPHELELSLQVLYVFLGCINFGYFLEKIKYHIKDVSLSILYISSTAIYMF